MDRILSLLGLARKAGRIVDGEAGAEECVRRKKAFLLIVAEDASERTARVFLRLAEEMKCPVFRYGTKQSLGAAIGKNDRAVIALLDRGFSETLINELLPKEVYGNED